MPEGARGRIAHSGRVLGPDGAPAAGALVAVARGDAATPDVAVRTDVGGRFVLALPAGCFEIEARSREGGRGKAAVRVAGQAVDILVRLGGAGESDS